MNQNVTTLQASTRINATPEEVWSVLKDFGNISAYHPLIKSSHRTNEINGIGAKRVCKLLPMGSMEEQIIQYSEGKSFVVEVVDGQMLPPCSFMRGTIELHKRNNQTEVTFTFSYAMKLGIVGQLMNILMIKPQFRKAPIRYVEGLKDYMESSKFSLV